MFKVAKSNEEIGAYLGKLIDENYASRRQFGRKYLEMLGRATDDYEVRKMSNRISQMISGKKAIQIDDLPYFTELLMVSCEQLLSCGKCYEPIRGHVTNYQIAYSKDRKMWDRYMKREDKLFLNADEYCKTVVDYALEYKNYAFIKYLLDEGFIWFVDNGEHHNNGYIEWYGFGADTSIERRKFELLDWGLPGELKYQDTLRQQTIALAIENEDIDILDSLKAREHPEWYHLNYSLIRASNHNDYKIFEYKCEELIEAVANSGKAVVEYYGEEMEIVPRAARTKILCMYPFLGEIIEKMLDNNSPFIEILLNKAIAHSTKIYEFFKEKVDEEYQRTFQCEMNQYKDYRSEEENFAQARRSCCHEDKNGIYRLDSFEYSYEYHIFGGYYPVCVDERGKQHSDVLIANLILVNKESKNAAVNNLIQQLNELGDKISKLGIV